MEPPSNYSAHGQVILKNAAIIENAKYAIRTIKAESDQTEGEQLDYHYSGGQIVMESNSRIRNCEYGVCFYPYEYDHISVIKDAVFETTAELSNTSGLPYTHIYLNDVFGVDFKGCTFINSRESTAVEADERGMGIYSYNSGFNVVPYCTSQIDPCPSSSQQPNHFENLYYGIKALNSGSVRTFTVDTAEFENNVRGLYASAIDLAEVIRCDFKTWDNTNPFIEDYGLYLDNCTGYMIEENYFHNDEQVQEGVGLVINNSGSDFNEIYNNQFENTNYATLTQGCNRDADPDYGLKIKCNDYWNNDHDIVVSYDTATVYPGISKAQGAPGATQMQAGNTFSHNNNGISTSDFYNIKDGFFTYYHHDPDSTPSDNVVPIYYTNKYISLSNEGNPYSKLNSCASHIDTTGGGGQGEEEMRSSMVVNENEADSVQAILTALVDGGNTSVLEQQVYQSMPPQSYDLYMNLMGKSPYLSDSVLLAAIEKENVLNNAMIKEILIANPQSAKSGQVMDKVDEKTNPLTEEMIAEILLGKYMVAAKEKLESQVSWYRHQRAMTLNRLLRSYRNDTIHAWANDSLQAILTREKRLSDKYRLTLTYFANGNVQNASNVLEVLPGAYTMNAQQLAYYDDMNDFFDIYSGLPDSLQIDSLTEVQLSVLQALADYLMTRPAAYARNLLMEYAGYPYQEPIILPEEGLKAAEALVNNDLTVGKTSADNFSIYPNPADNVVIIDMKTVNSNGIRVSLYDNQGRPVKTVVIPAWEQQFIMGTGRLETGIYLVKLEKNGKTLGTKKLSIIR
ncbi:MAG: T9SS type A sorting domain-containing protein [Bacteroidetes bacterium]|nr:T9SS type A sorting domain-containing protein [Bacteroidota bacterium]